MIDLTKYKAKTKTYIEIDFSQFEELLNELYPMLAPFEFAEIEGLQNYSKKSYNVRKDYVMRKRMIESLKEMIEKKMVDQSSIGLLLQIAAQEKQIPYGEYLIDVSW